MGVEVCYLGDVADGAFADFGDGSAEDFHGAGDGDGAEDSAEEGGFSGAVGADEGEGFAGVECAGNAGEDGWSAVGEGGVIEFEGGGAGVCKRHN